MDTGGLSGKPEEMLGVVSLVASCYRNRNKFQLNGPFGSSSDFTLDLSNSSPFFSILDHFHLFDYSLYLGAKAFQKHFNIFKTDLVLKKESREYNYLPTLLKLWGLKYLPMKVHHFVVN